MRAHNPVVLCDGCGRNCRSKKNPLRFRTWSFPDPNSIYPDYHRFCIECRSGDLLPAFVLVFDSGAGPVERIEPISNPVK